MIDIGPIFRSLLRSKLGAVLIVLQIALTMAIITNAAFIVKQRAEHMNQSTGLDEANTASFVTRGTGNDDPAMNGIPSSHARSYIHFASDHTGPRCLSLNTGTTRLPFSKAFAIASKKRRLGYRCWPFSFHG